MSPSYPFCLIANATGSSSRGSGSSHAPTSCLCSGRSGVRHNGASLGHRSEHLADITWDPHVRATAGAECRKRIGLRDVTAPPLPVSFRRLTA